MKVSHVRLKALLSYNEKTGEFTWRVKKGPVNAGDRAGGPASWGWRVFIDGRFYQANVLAWFYVHGEWPKLIVDHIDRNPLNNVFSNLRLATVAQNKANCSIYKNNKLRVKGVRLHRNGQYEARIRKDGHLVYIGCFRTIDEAKNAYNSYASELFGEFANLHPG